MTQNTHVSCIIVLSAIVSLSAMSLCLSEQIWWYIEYPTKCNRATSLYMTQGDDSY